MPKHAIALLLGVCALGCIGVAVTGAADERALAFTFNVRPTHAVTAAAPGGEACQSGIEAAARFDVIEALIGTNAQPAPQVPVTVREVGSGRVLAKGRVPEDARDNAAVRLAVSPPVEEGRLIDVCFRNEGAREVAFYGGPTHEAPGHAFAGARAGSGDMRLVFFRSEPRSALSLVPDMFRRSALFRPEPVGAWTFWLLLALVALGVPLLLAAAVRAAART